MFDFAVFSLALAAISVLLAKVLHFHTKKQRLAFAFADSQPVPIKAPSKAPSKSGRSARAAYLLSYVH